MIQEIGHSISGNEFSQNSSNNNYSQIPQDNKNLQQALKDKLKLKISSYKKIK